MEYQLATYTPLNKTAKKKKIKRKPAEELEPIPVHYLLLNDIFILISVWLLDIWRFDYSFERAEFCLCCAAIRVRAGSRTASEAKSHPDGRSGSCYSLSFFQVFWFRWLWRSVQGIPIMVQQQHPVKPKAQPNRRGKNETAETDHAHRRRWHYFNFDHFLNSEYSLRVSDSLNIFARSDLCAQFRV